MKNGVKGACFSVPLPFHSILSFVAILFSSENISKWKTDTRLMSYLRLRSVMMLQYSASVNACTRSVHICSQSCSSNHPRPLSVKYRPISNQFRCLVLSPHFCSCLQAKQGRFFTRFRSCWTTVDVSATNRFTYGTDIESVLET